MWKTAAETGAQNKIKNLTKIIYLIFENDLIKIKNSLGSENSTLIISLTTNENH